MDTEQYEAGIMAGATGLLPRDHDTLMLVNTAYSAGFAKGRADALREWDIAHPYVYHD